MRPYLRHRIQVAGGRCEQLFPPGAEHAFAQFSAGPPRLINLLADRVLLGAYAEALRPVPPAFVEAKAKEIVTGRAVAPPKPDREEP